MDPSENPYLAHMYNGFDQQGSSSSRGSGAPDTILSSFKRYQTTVADATKAENGPENPFTGRPLSNNYFKILETRRNLPVHQQR